MSVYSVLISYFLLLTLWKRDAIFSLTFTPRMGGGWGGAEWGQSAWPRGLASAGGSPTRSLGRSQHCQLPASSVPHPRAELWMAPPPGRGLEAPQLPWLAGWLASWLAGRLLLSGRQGPVDSAWAAPRPEPRGASPTGPGSSRGLLNSWPWRCSSPESCWLAGRSAGLLPRGKGQGSCQRADGEGGPALPLSFQVEGR